MINNIIEILSEAKETASPINIYWEKPQSETCGSLKNVIIHHLDILEMGKSNFRHICTVFPIFKSGNTVIGGRCYHQEITKIEVLDENFGIVSVYSINNKKEK